METYATLSGIYDVVRAAYAKTVYVDKAFQRKTNSLVQEHVGTTGVEKVHDLFEINKDTIELIKKKHAGGLSPTEHAELGGIQAEMLRFRQKVAPLPLEDARQLHQELLARAAAPKSPK